MKIAHNVKLSVFAYEGEDINRIEQAFLFLLPFNPEDEKLKIKRTTAVGFKERRIAIFEIMLTKERHTSKFLGFLKNALSEDQRSLVLRQAESRLDQELNFFIRLDKQHLLDKEFSVTDSGNCFHIRISVAAYPAKRAVALKIVRQWLE